MLKKIVWLLLSCLCCSTLWADPIKQFVILGDSLTDNGNLYRILKIVPPTPPYYKGRFSNGPTWAEYVADNFANKYAIDTQNYAYGGATAIIHDPRTDSFIAPMTLEGELNEYLFHAIFTDKSHVLYGIWIGANDYLYDREPNVDALTSKVVDKVAWAMTVLIKQGAQHFLILNLPDLAITPYAKEEHLTERLHTMSQLHNQKLNDAINNIKNAYPKVDIVFVNTYDLLSDVVANPDKYNQQYGTHFRDTVQPCWVPSSTSASHAALQQDLLTQYGTQAQTKDINAMSHFILDNPSLATAYAVGKAAAQGATMCTNEDEHLFWDVVHPTAPVHRILGQMVILSLPTTVLQR